MTRAEWQRKHRLYHPYDCKACGAPKQHPHGACSICADARARSDRYPSMQRKRRVA